MHHRAVIQHVVLAHARRLAIGVHVFDRHVLAGELVPRQRVTEARKPCGLVVDGHSDRALQVVEHLRGFVRQREGFRGREVPLLVAPDGQVVEAHQNREHRHHAHRRHGAVARLALGERAGDVPPLAQRVQHDAHQAGDGRVVGVLIPLGVKQPDRHAAKTSSVPIQPMIPKMVLSMVTRASVRCRPT